MVDFDRVDFFSDASLLEDPYPYFEHLRAKCPLTPLPHHGVVAISGLEEASDIYRDPDTQPGSAKVRVPRRVQGRPAEHQGAHRLRTRYPLLCPGGPLARAEGRISLERILDRMRDI